MGRLVRRLFPACGSLAPTCPSWMAHATCHPLTPPPAAVVLLNDTGLFDLLFDEAHVMDFVGALEYEPGVPAGRGHCMEMGACALLHFHSIMCRQCCSLLTTQLSPPAIAPAEVKPEQRARHRDFLRDQACFKEVVPIADPAVRTKIHQTYR